MNPIWEFWQGEIFVEHWDYIQYINNNDLYGFVRDILHPRVERKLGRGPLAYKEPESKFFSPTMCCFDRVARFWVEIYFCSLNDIPEDDCSEC